VNTVEKKSFERICHFQNRTCNEQLGVVCLVFNDLGWQLKSFIFKPQKGWSTNHHNTSVPLKDTWPI